RAGALGVRRAQDRRSAGRDLPEAAAHQGHRGACRRAATGATVTAAVSLTAPGLPPAADVDSSLRAVARIGRNFSFRMAAQILSALINVGAMVLLGNYLNAAGYGDYVFYYALIPLIASLSDLGAGVMITKGVARDKLLGPRFYGDAILIKAAVGVPLLAVVGFTSWALLDPARAALVTLVCATALIDFSQDVSVWIVRAH